LINRIMAPTEDKRITIDLVRKYMKIITSSVAIAVAVGSVTWNTVIWVDSRYMYKNISDHRWIEAQIMILQSDIREYNRHVQSGNIPSDQERVDYEIATERMKDLLDERNRLLGLGGND